MTALQDKIAAVIDAAREAEAAINAYGKCSQDDPAEDEERAMFSTGHRLHLALQEYDMTVAANRRRAADRGYAT